MTKIRLRIPKSVAESVLKEYRHECAMCGRHTPQLHHVDQNPSNNTVENLRPLCPNCHLQDIHDPTSPPDVKKLQLFRKYKDPLILDPRFHPIFRRFQCLLGHNLDWASGRFKYLSSELLDFVEELQMGGFYRKKLSGHLTHPYTHLTAKLQDEGQKITKEEVLKSPELRERALQYCVERVEFLIVELLRYQGWKAEAFRDDR